MDNTRVTGLMTQLHRRVLEPLKARYGIFARAHALRFRTGRFWLRSNGSGIVFTAHAAGPDLEVVEANFGYSVVFSNQAQSAKLHVQENIETVPMLLEALITLGLKIEPDFVKPALPRHLRRGR